MLPADYGDMDPEDFRREAHRIADWIADYFAAPERYPVLAQVQPGDIRSALPPSAPERARVVRRHLRGLRADDRPRHHALESPRLLRVLRHLRQRARRARRVPVGGAQRQQAMLWRTSPAATELEEVSLAWLRQLLGLPDAFEGVIYDTASISTLHALAAAREPAAAGVRTRGLAGRATCRSSASTAPSTRTRRSTRRSSCSGSATTRCAGSKPTTSSACVPRPSPPRSPRTAPRHPAAGGRRDGRHDVDDQRRSRRRDREPSARASASGCTSTRRTRASRRCFPTSAGSCTTPPPPTRSSSIRTSGCSRRSISARSTAAAWTWSARRSRSTPEYLKTPEAGEVQNLMDTGMQLGRRFRALKLWMVLRHFGAEGIRARIAEHIRLAQLFAGWVDDSPNSSGPRRRRSASSVSARRRRTSSTSGCWTASTRQARFSSRTRKLDGRYTLRLAIGNLHTTERHVERAWALIREIAGQLKRDAVAADH